MNSKKLVAFFVGTSVITLAVTGCSAAYDGAGADESDGVHRTQEALTDGGTAASAPYTVSYWNYVDAGSDFYNVDSRVTVLNDAPQTGYYYSNDWNFRNQAGSAGGYMGLQSGASLPDGGTGKLAIFSIWNAVAASPGPGATCLPFGGEGTGLSCHLPYAWTAGHTYRLRTWVLSGQTWGAWVLDENSGVESYIGQITAPSQNGWITQSANFAEHFAPDISSCSQLPYTRVQFHRPTANNGTIVAAYPTDYKDHGTCDNYSIEYDAYQTSAFHSIGDLPCGGLAADQGLHAGQAVRSCDGRFTLIMQTDGNLVLYMAGVGALWSTRTNGTSGNYAVMQGDGNFVVYGGNALWATATWGHPGSHLAVQNDGNVVVYQGATPLWASGTSGH